jgi:hypothetical protein
MDYIYFLNTTHMKSYEMYTPAGDRACGALVKSIQTKILSKERVTPTQIAQAIEDGQVKIEAKHPEVYDTEPRSNICHEISKTLKDAGYGFFIDSYVNPCDGVYPYYN